MCNCLMAWSSVAPPPPCPVHTTVPLVVICGCKQAPWISACAHKVLR